MALATRLILDARTQASRELRLGIDSVIGVAVTALPRDDTPALATVERIGTKRAAIDASRVPKK